MSDLTSANSLVRPLHCLQSTPCHQQKAGHPHSLASFTILSKISHGESATLPYTLIHFKPLLMFLPHLHSHLTLHVQKLYCPHKLLSHLSLCQSFPQLHSVHSVIRFLRSSNATNNHLLFSVAFSTTCLNLYIYVLFPLKPTCSFINQPFVQPLNLALKTVPKHFPDSLLYNCCMSTCSPSCEQE